MKFEPTTANSPVYQENEDATMHANLCAQGLGTPLIDVIKAAKGLSEDKAEELIEAARREHRKIFDAFIYGVAHGRANPNEKDGVLERIWKLLDVRVQPYADGTRMKCTCCDPKCKHELWLSAGDKVIVVSYAHVEEFQKLIGKKFN